MSAQPWFVPQTGRMAENGGGRANASPRAYTKESYGAIKHKSPNQPQTRLRPAEPAAPGAGWRLRSAASDRQVVTSTTSRPKTWGFALDGNAARHNKKRGAWLATCKF